MSILSVRLLMLVYVNLVIDIVLLVFMKIYNWIRVIVCQLGKLANLKATTLIYNLVR